MTRINSKKIKWRVQFRRGRAKPWKNAMLYPTRDMARQEAAFLRIYTPMFDVFQEPGGYGFGNTRVVRHISGKGKAA